MQELSKADVDLIKQACEFADQEWQRHKRERFGRYIERLENPTIIVNEVHAANVSGQPIHLSPPKNPFLLTQKYARALKAQPSQSSEPASQEVPEKPGQLDSSQDASEASQETSETSEPASPSASDVSTEPSQSPKIKLDPPSSFQTPTKPYPWMTQDAGHTPGSVGPTPPSARSKRSSRLTTPYKSPRSSAKKVAQVLSPCYMPTECTYTPPFEDVKPDKATLPPPPGGWETTEPQVRNLFDSQPPQQITSTNSPIRFASPAKACNSLLDQPGGNVLYVSDSSPECCPPMPGRLATAHASHGFNRLEIGDLSLFCENPTLIQEINFSQDVRVNLVRKSPSSLQLYVYFR